MEKLVKILDVYRFSRHAGSVGWMQSLAYVFDDSARVPCCVTCSKRGRFQHGTSPTGQKEDHTALCVCCSATEVFSVTRQSKVFDKSFLVAMQ
jgi:hypothetical protein